MPTWSSPQANWLDTPNTPAIRFTRELHFAASLVHNCYGLSGCSPPLDGSDWNNSPATGGIYVQAFDGSVTLAVAGYDYDIDWTPMSAGLAPAGMAASFAALARMEPSLGAQAPNDGAIRDSADDEATRIAPLAAPTRDPWLHPGYILSLSTIAAAKITADASRNCRFITLPLALRGNGSRVSSIVSGTL